MRYYVELDTMNDDDAGFLDDLNEHDITMRRIGGPTCWPCYRYTGNWSNLRDMILTHWADEGLVEYIKPCAKRIDIRIRKDRETDEWVVRYTVDDQRDEELDYFTDDKDDAVQTANFEAKRYVTRGWKLQTVNATHLVLTA